MNARQLKQVIGLFFGAVLICACAAQPTPEARPIPLTATLTQLPATASPTKTPLPTQTSSPAPTPDKTAALVEALRKGGYVIYFRHATTDQSQLDTDTPDLKNCAKQRNLNEQGRAEALAIGRAILSLRIPIGQVLSSQYCRARDTAMLAFGQAEISTDLTGFPNDLREERIAALRKMLSTQPNAGTNTVLVAHGFNITNTAGITIAEGEAAIFMPLGADGFRLVGRVLPEEWTRLAQLSGALLQARFGDQPDLLLPDLQTLPSAHFVLRVNPVTGRRIIRFTNAIMNGGPGAMEIWGYSETASGKTIVIQKINTPQGTPRNVVVGEFVFHPEHDHWHFGDFARYEILSLTTNGALGTVVAVSGKISYCLRDDLRSELPDAPRGQSYLGCNQKMQGISAGWMDVYRYHLPGQSIEITNLSNGIYALRSIVNPGNQLWEGNPANNAAIVYIEIADRYVQIIDKDEVLERFSALQ